MRVIEHRPGRRLVLAMADLPEPAATIYGVVFFALLTGVPLILVLWWLEGVDAFLAACFVLFAGALTAMFRPAVRIEIDRDGNELRITTATLALLVRRERVVALDAIDRLVLERPFSTPSRGFGGSRVRPGPARFSLIAEDREREQIGAWKVTVEGYDGNDDGEVLLEELAATAGLPHVRVVKRDAMRVTVEATRAPPVDPGAAPGSPDEPGADAARDDVLGAFRPGRPPAGLEFAVAEWAPGSRVRLTSSWHWSDIGLLAVVNAAVILVLASEQIHPWLPAVIPELWIDPSEPVLLVMACLIGVFTIGIPLWSWREARGFGVSFDWQRGTASVRRRRGPIEFPLADIDSLELRGLTWERTSRSSSGSSSTRQVFALHLVANVRGRGSPVRLADSGSLPGGEVEAAYDFLYRFGSGLAAALGTRFVFVDFRRPGEYASTE